ncbi:hypothetical protein [Mycobacterium sp.]|nr:hypothetical protein [Mycobacterium sp.]
MTSIDEPDPDDLPLLSDAIPTREELAELVGVDADDIDDEDDD